MCIAGQEEAWADQKQWEERGPQSFGAANGATNVGISVQWTRNDLILTYLVMGREKDPESTWNSFKSRSECN